MSVPTPIARVQVIQSWLFITSPNVLYTSESMLLISAWGRCADVESHSRCPSMRWHARRIFHPTGVWNSTWLHNHICSRPGDNLELLRLFFSLLPQRTKWHVKATEPAQFIIDETFGVPGVGTVVAGEGAGCRVCAFRSYSFLYLILIPTRGSVSMDGKATIWLQFCRIFLCEGPFYHSPVLCAIYSRTMAHVHICWIRDLTGKLHSQWTFLAELLWSAALWGCRHCEAWCHRDGRHTHAGARPCRRLLQTDVNQIGPLQTITCP